jgi:hypothetical protein
MGGNKFLSFPEGLDVKTLEAVERGESPDTAKLLANHADVAQALKQFFADCF